MTQGFWGKLNKPIMAMAPMANVTDAAFRRMFAEVGGPDGKPDIGLINEQLPGLVQRLTAVGAFRNAGITAQMPTAIQNPEQIDKFLANIGGLKAAADLALEQNKTKAEAAQSIGAATESTAKAAQLQAQLPVVQAQAGMQLQAIKDFPKP